MSEELLQWLSSFWDILVAGLTLTVPLTIISFSLAMIIAVITALIQYANIRVLKHIARFYIWFIRGTPLLVQLYLVFYGLPGVGILIDAFPAAIIVLSINTGAYTAETIRGALESVPTGQLEAGYCVGMNYLQIIRRIVLPQAMRSALPSLGNNLISLVKDTSLASTITVAEMLMEAKRIIAAHYNPLEMYLAVAIIYLFFSTLLSKLQTLGEKRLSTYQKHGGRK